MRANLRPNDAKHRLPAVWLVATLALLCLAAHAWGADADPPADTPAKTPADAPAAGDDLSVEQAQLADRFQRLEVVVGRLAEVSAGTDPRRAKLLREAIAQSREQDIQVRFDSTVKLLEDERLSAAANNQTELKNELDSLLTLLLKADRDSQIESEARRIRKYLQEVGRLIRLQKGLQARTEGGDNFKPLSQDQQQVAEETGKLGRSIAETEGTEKKSDESSKSDEEKSDQGNKNGADKIKKSEQSKDDQSSKPGDSSQKTPPDGKPSDAKPSDGKPSAGGPSPGKPSDAAPSDSGKPSSSPSNPSQGSPPSGSPSDGSESPPQDAQQQQPTDRAAQRLDAAQQRMQQAREKLDKAQREGATADQSEALKELQQAKAELERILRQLREEERERTLTMLAARFRKMLEAQVKVYDGTVRVDKVPESERGHDQEIESARLSREESLIVREADKAMLLLREEGSSVAFPEAVEQMREDMQQVTARLGDLKVGMLTQELEQDVIAALEETIAALEKALKDLEKNHMPPGQMGAGEAVEPPLVDKLAELKMIRSLQMRINRRTQRYGEMIATQQAETPELIEALDRLAERQQRVYRATIDLSQGRND
jgi:hypothetical protein